jgi:hypothetical protein
MNGQKDRVRYVFLQGAQALTPELHKWTEFPLEVVTFKLDPSEYVQYRGAHQYTTNELSRLEWGKGDEFTIDFGTQRIECFSFHLAVK